MLLADTGLTVIVDGIVFTIIIVHPLLAFVGVTLVRLRVTDVEQ
jgi:hypothetical protein